CAATLRTRPVRDAQQWREFPRCQQLEAFALEVHDISGDPPQARGEQEWSCDLRCRGAAPMALPSSLSDSDVCQVVRKQGVGHYVAMVSVFLSICCGMVAD